MKQNYVRCRMDGVILVSDASNIVKNSSVIYRVRVGDLALSVLCQMQTELLPLTMKSDWHQFKNVFRTGRCFFTHAMIIYAHRRAWFYGIAGNQKTWILSFHSTYIGPSRALAFACFRQYPLSFRACKHPST